MNLKRYVPNAPSCSALQLALIAALAACSGKPKPKPAELPANLAVIGVRQAWNVRIPAVEFPFATTQR